MVKIANHHRLTIAILTANGISIEIMPPIVTILDALNGRLDLGLKFVEHAIGLALLECSGTTLTDH